MVMKNMSKMLVVAMVAALAMLATLAPVAAAPQATTPTTCANEGYAYTKLQWCVAICESSLSQAQKDVYTRRWIDRYRDLPYCLLE
jgi:hypothetical protein